VSKEPLSADPKLSPEDERLLLRADYNYYEGGDVIQLDGWFSVKELQMFLRLMGASNGE